MISDLKFATRVLAKSPGFAFAAILMLALGIGLNTAMFTVLHAIVFSPRPFRDPGQLVQLHGQDREAPTRFRPFSYEAYRQLNERPDLFRGVLAQKLTLVALEDNGAAPRRALASLVSSNFLEVLGLPAPQGRTFTREEEVPGANIPVVMLSHASWLGSGARSDAVGSTLRINGRTFTVVGIAPEGFRGTSVLVGPDYYFPLGVFDSLAGKSDTETHPSLAQADVFPLLLTARVQSGVSPSALAAALTGFAAGLEQANPVTYRHQTIITGDVPRDFPSASPANNMPLRVVSVVLLGLTGAVLLIVSLNLTGLFLVRGHARRKEFAIRLALGGTRHRIVRQLLIEGFLLALAGGALGCLCALGLNNALIAAVARHLPIELFLTVGTPPAVLGATLLFSTLATVFFALGPALALSRRDLVADLQQNAGEDVPSRRRWLPRHPLVVAQIALSLALVIGAGCFARLTARATGSLAGIDEARLLVVELDASLARDDRTRTLETFRTLNEKLATLPGIAAASVALSTPYSLNGDSRAVRQAGITVTPEARPTTAAEGLAFTIPANAVGQDYFATLGLRLLRGRAFTAFETDHFGAPAVAIVDEALAAQLFPGEEALGRRLAWGDRDASASSPSGPPEAVEIVGIVQTARLEVFEEKSGGAIYVPLAQGFAPHVHFLLRANQVGETALAALIDPIRQTVRAGAEVPFFKIQTFTAHRDDSLEVWLLNRLSRGSVAFGAIAALIAVIGLYGAKAYTVARRTREIGIRLALGAEPARVRNLFLREGLSSGLTGIVLGCLLGLALGRLLESGIVNLNGHDPLVIALAAGGVFLATLAATWLPARRATQVTPLEAIRTE